MKHKSLIAAILIAIALQAVYAFLDRVPDFDEAVYLNLARSLETHWYPTSPTHPDETFFKHPPLHFYVVRLSTAAFGDSLPGARTGISLLSIVVLVVFYSIARKIATRAAGAGVLLLAVNPAFLFYGHSVYMETTVTLLIMLAIAALMGPERTASYAWAGLATGLAFVTKYYSFALVAGVSLFWLYVYRRQMLSRGRWAYYVVAGTVVAVWLLVAVSVDRRAFIDQTGAWFKESSGAVSSWRTTGNLKFALELAGVLTPVVSAAGIIGLVAGTVRRSRTLLDPKNGLPVLFVAFFSVYLLVTPIKDVKYGMPILPWLCLYAATLLAPLLRRGAAATAATAVVLIATSTPLAHFPNPLDRTLQPNIYAFSVERDKEYRNYKRAGEFLRGNAMKGDWFYASERAAIIAYYARMPHRDLWWDQDPKKMDEGLSDASYVVMNSNSPYLTDEPRERAQAYVETHFDRLAQYPGKNVDLTVWRKVSPPALGSR
jgi:4-amino-4-deoxy-L-arabinose transferase-like glycosyltransferase